jgi:hypothetical protein
LAPQLKRKAVNRPNAEANLLGNLHDACSLPKLGTCAFKGGRVIEWPAKCFAVRNGSLKASMNPLRRLRVCERYSPGAFAPLVAMRITPNMREI